MTAEGKLIVLEGQDGVGKSTLAEALTATLQANGVEARCLAFPGNEHGTLGHLVYRLHHDAQGRLVSQVSAAALQTLHVAAHLDAIEKQILPALHRGQSIVLDRYWWSTWVYGHISRVSEDVLAAMLELERAAWGYVRPTVAFLITSERPLRTGEDLERWRMLAEKYLSLAEREGVRYPVEPVANDRSVQEVVERLVTTLARLDVDIKGHFNRVLGPGRPATGLSSAKQMVLGIPGDARRPVLRGRGKDHGFAPAIPTPVFDSYWRFAVERQEVFFRRLEGAPFPWSADPILQRHRFTNAYRASDRVSQYLIRQVQYVGELGAEDVFFRTIIFKLFNRIETWELLEREVGGVHAGDFKPERYERILQRAMQAGQRIYSAAYIMPAAPDSFGRSKHAGHLRLLARMLRDELPQRLAEARSLRNAFELIRAYPMMGDFLAFQYAIDLNYSQLLNFSEMEFVVPGPGARSGLRKCFQDPGGLSEADMIRLVTERQADEFARRGLVFRDLWGRSLQLIDCQNLFCEVDKYARVAHPEVSDRAGRTRIKQVLRPAGPPPWPWYPPKWGVNQRIHDQYGAAHAPD